MFCPECGNEVEQHFQFCNRCGRGLAAVTAEEKKVQKMASHVTILGWIFVGSGVLSAILGMTVIFAGRLIAYLPIAWPNDVPFDVQKFAVSIAVVLGIAMVAVAAAIAAAGVGLLYYRSWGRVLAIVMSVFLLFKFPIGTAIGVYAFWVLLSEPGRKHYQARAALGQA